jgi:hypothetical protein
MFPFALDTLTATFLMAIAILVAGVGLITLIIVKDTEEAKAKQVYTAVGVLFGLLAAGGVGGIFATKVAESAATTAVKEAGTTTSKEISKEVSGQVAVATKSAEEATAQAEKATEAVQQATEAVEESNSSGSAGSSGAGGGH